MLKLNFLVILIVLVLQGSLGKPLDNEMCLSNQLSMIDLISEINSKLDRILAIPHIERDLSSQQIKLRSNIKAELKGIRNKVKIQFQIPTATTVKPRNFELIGKRSFYIEFTTKKSWADAAAACREIGGFLAAFENQEELKAIQGRLNWWWYWTGINDLNTEEYVSLASGKPSAVYKRKNETNHIKSCVSITPEFVHEFDCNSKFNFICQRNEDT